MTGPVVYGLPASTYCRSVRLALHEKGVDHQFVVVDVFAEQGVPESYRRRHPFGRIPAFEDDGFDLYETGAILRYLDRAFPGKPLQPQDLRALARMDQILSLIDSYAYRSLVWDILVEVAIKPKEGGITDPAVVARGERDGLAALRALSDLKGESTFLVGEGLTLADLHAYPVLAYTAATEVGRGLLAETPSLEAWRLRLAQRPSAEATRFPSET